MTAPHPPAHAPGTIVLATRNPGKVRELRDIIAARSLPGIAHIVGLDDLEANGAAPFPEPDETGRTFLDNATLKARAYAAMTGLPCLGDDSGLEVDALDGRPGVDSAYYAYPSESDARAHPREARDHANNARLLADLAAVPFDRRTARFICQMVLAEPDGTIRATGRGSFEGSIGLPATETDDPARTVPRGTNGFGYDPLFLVAPALDRTSAELPPHAKHAISHRGHAIAELIQTLARTPTG